MLSVQDLRMRHAHFFASRPDITDLMLQDMIDVLWLEYGDIFNDDPQLVAETAAGYAICHRAQLLYVVCSPASKMAGRATTIQSETDRITTNAKAMANPSDWSSTSCGGMFQKYIDKSSFGIAPFCGC